MQAEKNYVPRYYEEKGRGHDMILRCKDCQSIVPFKVMSKIGCCDKCGNRRFIEITVLNQEEFDDIQSGKLDFPDRELFLKEFSAQGGV